MERRIIAKQFIDMDELSKPWESENKLVVEQNEEEKHISNADLIEQIKNAKNLYLEQEGYTRKKILK